jgi:hypothetical protein
MDPLLLLMRLLHIVLGVFWVGAVIFNAVFLAPSLRDAGPDGAKVIGGLMKRRFLDVLPVVALATILSGLWLYWHASAGFQSVYLHSPTGATFAVGGILAIIGFGIGLAVMRPSMLKAIGLTQAAANATVTERDTMLAQAQALRGRAAGAGRWVAVLLVLTAAAMAIARYL